MLSNIYLPISPTFAFTIIIIIVLVSACPRAKCVRARLPYVSVDQHKINRTNKRVNASAYSLLIGLQTRMAVSHSTCCGLMDAYTDAPIRIRPHKIGTRSCICVYLGMICFWGGFLVEIRLFSPRVIAATFAFSVASGTSAFPNTVPKEPGSLAKKIA